MLCLLWLAALIVIVLNLLRYLRVSPVLETYDIIMRDKVCWVQEVEIISIEILQIAAFKQPAVVFIRAHKTMLFLISFGCHFLCLAVAI